MKLLEVRNLKLEFLDTIPPTQVTKGISFSMEPGEILGIVGESGSGKTQTALSPETFEKTGADCLRRNFISGKKSG